MGGADDDAPVRASLLITGRVQGVFYRASAMEAAQRLGIVGWVRNLPDGGVEAVAEGPREAVAEFVRWCGDGPPAARVDDVRVDWSAATGEFTTFRVAR
jgi:acylphosphatase